MHVYYDIYLHLENIVENLNENANVMEVWVLQQLLYKEMS